MTGINEQVMRSMLALATIVLTAALAVTAHAQAPIRIGASLSQAGSFANLGKTVFC